MFFVNAKNNRHRLVSREEDFAALIGISLKEPIIPVQQRNAARSRGHQ
jgi:hypothetical protein